MENKCKTFIHYTCTDFGQKKCSFFKQDKYCPTWKCAHGLFGRPCTSDQATEESWERFKNEK